MTSTSVCVLRVVFRHLTRTSARPSHRGVSSRACSLPLRGLGIAHPRPQLRSEVSRQHPLPESRSISMWPGPFRQLCSPPRSPASSDLDPRASVRATRISYAASDAHHSLHTMAELACPCLHPTTVAKGYDACHPCSVRHRPPRPPRPVRSTHLSGDNTRTRLWSITSQLKTTPIDA